MATEKQVELLWDTDIGRDPDDFLAGCFLLSRPEIRLRAITISPGDRDQVALARFLLRETGHLDVPVGVDLERERGKKSVGGCHVRLMEYYKAPRVEDADGAGWEVLRAAICQHPAAVLLTTGPLNNVGHMLKNTDICLERSVTMGGYWPEQGEEPAKQEFNFNGCGWATRVFIEAKSRFQRRFLVGKNLTHTPEAAYDETLHQRLRNNRTRSRPLALAYELMTLSGKDKQLHDPLAAAALVREELFQFQEVMPFKRDQKWSAFPQQGSGIWAATAFDGPRFRAMFVGED